MNAVIYARYSSDNQREESIEGQLRNVKVTARSMGIVLSSIILTVRFLQGRINVQISSV